VLRTFATLSELMAAPQQHRIVIVEIGDTEVVGAAEAAIR